MYYRAMPLDGKWDGNCLISPISNFGKLFVIKGNANGRAQIDFICFYLKVKDSLKQTYYEDLVTL